jgi:hypothetical protein
LGGRPAPRHDINTSSTFAHCRLSSSVRITWALHGAHISRHGNGLQCAQKIPLRTERNIGTGPSSHPKGSSPTRGGGANDFPDGNQASALRRERCASAFAHGTSSRAWTSP